MKISSITCATNSSIKNIYSKQNNLNVLKNNNISDCFSFTGRNNLKGKLSDVNKCEFPDDLYLDMDKVYKDFEKEVSYHRWEIFRHTLASLFVKRCNYLGLTNNAKFGVISYHNNKFNIEVSDYPISKNKKNFAFDWTKEFNELEDFFVGSENYPYGVSDNMLAIKEYLPEIMKKQGWIK